jgi:UPF0755 protein
MFKFMFRLVLAIVVVAATSVAVGVMGWNRIHEPYKGFGGDEKFVEVPPGAGSAAIRERLLRAGVIRDALTFRAALWWSGAARRLQAGEYRFDRALTPLEVIGVLERGEVYAHRITFPEGLTILEMGELFAMRELGTAKDFVAAAGNGSLVSDLDPAAGDLEGYLFPDTYALARGTPASQLVETMVARFKVALDENIRQRATAQNLSVRQVVTLASLVEKETARPEERPMVAAVYRNRLAIGMPMQADPTVVYALAKAGRYDGNIRKQDLGMDSPYNTYRYPGLPPGPIASPGKAALEAVVTPADVKHLYFVSRNDGSHVFADTLAQHNANVHEYQVLHFRKQRQ